MKYDILDYETDVDEVQEMMRALVADMDRTYGDEATYQKWLERVAFVGELASFALQKAGLAGLE
mgnify:FL=1